VADRNFLAEVEEEEEFHGIQSQKHLHKQSGDGDFPKVIYIPRNINPKTAVLVDDGVTIPRDQYELRWEDTGELIPIEE